MDEATREALEGSIKKWESIVAGTGTDRGSENCPLCQKYNRRQNRCGGCPVSEATGLSHCGGTPYDDWEEFCDEYGYDKVAIKYMADEHKAEASERATKELTFLKSLRAEPADTSPLPLGEGT